MRTSTAKAVQLVLLILLALLVLTPLLWLVSTSLKGPAEDIFSSPPALLPAQPSLDAYVRLFQDNPLTTYLFNSTVVSGLAVLANLLFCSLAAYPLARLRFAGRGLVLGVPKELEEAARIDGCSRLGEWWNVMIPAAKADLITLAMFVFIGTWSDFLWPLVILDDPSLYTLPLGLQQLSSSFSLDWRIVAAGSVVSILPVLVLFVLLQHFILPNASGDAVKG